MTPIATIMSLLSNWSVLLASMPMGDDSFERRIHNAIAEMNDLYFDMESRLDSQLPKGDATFGDINRVLEGSFLLRFLAATQRKWLDNVGSTLVAYVPLGNMAVTNRNLRSMAVDESAPHDSKVCMSCTAHLKELLPDGYAPVKVVGHTEKDHIGFDGWFPGGARMSIADVVGGLALMLQDVREEGLLDLARNNAEEDEL